MSMFISLLAWAIYFAIIYIHNGSLSQKDMVVYGFTGFIQYFCALLHVFFYNKKRYRP